TASSYWSSWTRMRLSCTHICPELNIESLTTYLMALATLAPGATTKGDLPPSSWQTRLTPPAAALAICTPTSVEPVKDTMSTSGWVLKASPITEPRPVTRLNTPAGRPTCSQTSANTKHD